MTPTPTLLSLAPELLCAIAEHVRIAHLNADTGNSNTKQVTEEDLMQLRLTCKYLGDTLESQVLHTIHFSVENCNYSRATARLQPLATTKNLLRGLPRSGRHLYIGPLSPKHIPDLGFPVRKPRDNPTSLLAEELMRTYLCDALSALRNLKSVTCVRGQFSVPPSSDEQPDSRWTPGMDDEAWTHEAVMEFLASCPSLHVFEVELTHLKVAVTLDRMQGLREISFTYDYRFPPAEPVKVQTYNNLTKLLASRPASQINQLSVVLTSLHEIFPFFTPEVEPLQLKDLRMYTSMIKLDPLTIPHLRHLTCLHLLNMMVPSKPWKVNLIPISPGNASAQEVKQEDCISSKMLNDFWLALQRAGIFLKEIKVDSINDGLLGYLTCYTGLTKLGIESCFLPSPESSDPLAKLFFAESLASHVETLEELNVKAQDEDLWCFGEHNVSAFSRCMGLKTLSVFVPKTKRPMIVSSRFQPEYLHQKAPKSDEISL